MLSLGNELPHQSQGLTFAIEKLRCEDSDGGTRPCLRCRQMSQACRVQSANKRVNKKTPVFVARP